MRRLLQFYKQGIPIDTIVKRYPQLKPAQVYDALSFALDNTELMDADVQREETIIREAERTRRT